MIKLLLFILTSTTFGQNLYDSNCVGFVKKNNFIKAKSDNDLNDSTRRTERYFYWDRINDYYSNFVNSDDLKKEASQRYSNDLKYSITKCPGNLQNCNSYKAYCVEEVSTKGIIEEIKKWNDVVKNCLNKKYRELHPDYCKKDFSRSLLYLKRMAQKLAKTNQQKSPDVALFFHEAKDQFQKYYNDMENLLAEIEKEKNQEAFDINQAIKKEDVINKLDICRNLIKDDDNDIGNKQYIDRLLGNYSKCSELNKLNDLNQDAILSLEKMMTDIDLKTQERYMLPEITKIALKQSVKATAATYMRFFNEKLNLNSSKSRSDFANKICSKMKNENCKKPGFKASMLVALQELGQETKDHPIVPISNEDLAKDTKAFNETLNKANRICQNTKKRADNIRKENKCSDESKYYDKIERLSLRGQQVLAKCEKVKQKKRDLLKSLNDNNSNLARGLYASATSTITGHLLVSEDFRDKVNLPSQNWLKERCIDGDGKAFNNVVGRDVSMGLLDLLKLNINEVSDIAGQKYSKDKKRAIIKDYLKNNPNTIVDLLNQNPDENYAKAICSFVREINSDDYIKTWAQRGVVGVGIVAGVALSITGVGAPIGVPLLATVGAATAAEAGMIIYDLNELNYNLKNQRQAASTGQFSLNPALDSIGKNEDELTSRKIDLALTLTFGTFDIAAESFKTTRMMYKANKALKADNVLNVTSDIAKTTEKGVPYQMARGIDQFRYHAKKVKLDPKKIKELSDAEKIELGAIFSRLSQKEQRALTLILSETKDVKSIKKLIKKVQSLSPFNFNEVYQIANRNNNLINSKPVKEYFKESEDLLVLQRQSPLESKIHTWKQSAEIELPSELMSNIQDHLKKNNVDFTETEKGLEIFSTDKTTPIGRFTEKMNNLGVKVIYNPSLAKQNNFKGANVLKEGLLYIDDQSLIQNKISETLFHEGSHAYEMEKYLQGIDDDFNLIFEATGDQGLYKVSEELLEKYNGKVPYLDRIWLHEKKVFSNQIRQVAASKNFDLDQLKSLKTISEKLTFVNYNSIQNTQKLLRKINELKSYSSGDIISSYLNVKKINIKGKEVLSLNFINKNFSRGIIGSSDAVTSKIFAVTKEQKKIAQIFLDNPNDLQNNLDFLNVFSTKANKNYNIAQENLNFTEQLFMKARSIEKSNAFEVSTQDQKEIITLAAKLAKTTKTPTPQGLKFNSKPKEYNLLTSVNTNNNLIEKVNKVDEVSNTKKIIQKVEILQGPINSSDLKFIAAHSEINEKYTNFLKAVLKKDQKRIKETYDILYEGLFELSNFPESQKILNQAELLKKNLSREELKEVKDLKNQYSAIKHDTQIIKKNIEFEYINLKSRNANKAIIGEINLENFDPRKFNLETKKAYVGKRSNLSYRQNPILLEKAELKSYMNFLKKNYDFVTNEFKTKTYRFRGESLAFDTTKSSTGQRGKIVAGDYFGGKTELNKDLGKGWREFDLPISSANTGRDGTRILYNGKKFLLTNDHYNSFYKINLE